MTVADEEEWLVDWFEQRGDIPANSTEGKLEVDYFEAGLIDSLDVVDLIAAIENRFNIEFDERNFQDRRFPQIGGLAEVIREIREQQEPKS